MENKSIRPFINEVYNQNLSIHKIDDLYSVFETIKGFQGFKGVIEYLSEWLFKKYKIRNISFSTFDIQENKTNVLFQKGLEIDFEKGKDHIYAYNIPIQPFLTGNLNLLFDTQKHYNEIQSEFVYIDALLCEVSLVIKNVIINNFLQASSIKDSVTRTYNRKGLDEHLEKLLPLARRENKKVAFLSVGIDQYKAVIDEFDYKIGEKVLIKLAKVLKDNTRTSDIVARIDSDEFMVILANVNNDTNAMMVAEKLVEEFAKAEVDVGLNTNQTLKKTICVGLSMFPEDSTAIEPLKKNADVALYEARNKGRSQVLKFELEQEGLIDLF